ncbi:Jmjc domain protein [Aphelenchoides avenae]|nr:Jmjc domain protein [Aphelenchus avenae]
MGQKPSNPAGMDSDQEETPEGDENSARCGVCNRTRVQKEDDNILNKVHLEMSSDGQMLITGDLDQLVKRDNTDNFWICCDGCRSWFHSSCVHVEQYESALIAAYHCANCVPRLGPSTWKESVLEHRHNDDKEEERHMPEQVGSKQWIRNLIETESKIPRLEDHLMEAYPDGHTLMKNFDHSLEWKKSMLIQKPEGLGLRMPNGTFDIDDCVSLVGADAIIDTIDVYAQKSYRMTMERFAQLWKGDRKRLYNILSLEISQHRLGESVDMPQLVRELSWAERFWSPLKSTHMYSVPDWLLKLVGDHPEAAVLAEHVRAKPNVEKFCLLSMGGSFTDCHIDFGGSSVWYHVYEGAKVFYVAPPTEENLQAYEDHCHDKHKTEHYMGALLQDGLRRIPVAKGETLMIPSGWIHSVYTPVDSIVFGGNFLHDLNIAMQLKINAIETRAKFDWRFMYPSFELVNWYAAQRLCEELKGEAGTLPL